MTPSQIETFVDAMAEAIGLPLHADHRPGVVHYFALAAGLAELVNGLPLGPADDPAEVFTPIAPRAGARGGAQQQ